MNAIPKPTIDAVWQRLRDWHINQRALELESAFELGDHLITVTVMTGLKREIIIAKLRAELKDTAYSPSTYRRAAHLATTFTPGNRKVLLSKCVSLNRAVVLASRQFDSKRVGIIANIKIGTLKKWSSIRSDGEIKNLARTKTLRHGLRHVDDVVCVQIRANGLFQRDLMHDGLASLLTQVPFDVLVDEINTVIERLRKRGKNVMQLRPATNKDTP
jgi:hypothetical protein